MPTWSGRHKCGAALVLILLLTLPPWTRLSAAVPGEPQEKGLVIMVIDRQNLPYQAVVEGFQDRLNQVAPRMQLETVYLTRSAPERAEALARLRANRPRLILALGSVALDAVSQSIEDVPILFGLVLSESYQSLPANVSGVYLDFPLEVQFSWLRRVLPQARTIGVIYNRQQNQATIALAERVAGKLGLQLESHAIASPQELPAALDALARSADVFWGVADQMVVTPETARTLLLFSFRNRIPFFGLSEAWVKAGALFALDRDYLDIGRQCAELAGRILQGEGVGTVPPEPPRRVLLFLNRRCAEQMKIKLTTELLKHAAKIY